MPPPSLLQRLKERKLVQWGVAYLFFAAGFLGVMDALETPLGLSPAIQLGVLTFVVSGFFITLVLAWFHGEKGKQAVSGVEVLLIAVLLWGAGFFCWCTQRGPDSNGSTENPADPLRIAVLPFLDVSPQDNQGHFASGIAGAILNALSTIPSLDVVDPQSSFQAEVVSSDPTEIGQLLGVAVLVGGQIEESRDTLRLSLTLTETNKGAVLWEEGFIWERAQLSSVYEVAWMIAEALLGTPADGSLPQMGTGFNQSPEAVELFVRGLGEAYMGDPSRLERAIEYFAAALAVDQNFALAKAAMANAQLDLGSSGPTLALVQEVVTDALDLDPALPQAHIVQGRLWNKPGSWLEAEREFRTAIRLRKSYAPAYRWLGNNLLVRGQSADGLHAFQRAADLDPLSAPIAVGLSQALSAVGDSEGAVAEARRATEINPSYSYGHSALAVALTEVGMFEEALFEAETAFSLLGETPGALATHAAVMARSGNRREVETILERLRNQTGTNSILPTALVYANLAQLDSAFALLNRVPAWTPPARDWIRNSPIWSPIRADPRWSTLLSNLGMN